MYAPSLQPPFWLRAAHVWHDESGMFVPRAILLGEDTILAVEPIATEVHPGDGWQVIDLPDEFVLPGLINTHVHLEFSASSRPLVEFEAESGEDRLLRALGNAHRMLLSGVTTIRDCGSSRSMLALARHPDFSPVPLPRLLCSGSPITPPGGHLHMMGGEAADLAGIREVIARNLGAGARSIKVMGSGGGMTPGTYPERATYDQATLSAVATEARDRDLPSVIHVLATESIRRGAIARFDSLEHCAFFDRNAEGRLERHYDQDTARLVADSGVAIMANLSTATRPFAALKQAPSRTADQHHQLAQFDLMLENFARFRELGIPIVCGTDAGVRDTPFEDTWREIVQMVATDMPPVEALRTATVNAARVLHLENRVGRIAVGFSADLIGLADNPLFDPATLAAPVRVISQGRRVVWPQSQQQERVGDVCHV